MGICNIYRLDNDNENSGNSNQNPGERHALLALFDLLRVKIENADEFPNLDCGNSSPLWFLEASN